MTFAIDCHGTPTWQDQRNETVENPAPLELRLDGEFLKRHGEFRGKLELPTTLQCDPLEHVLVINLQGTKLYQTDQRCIKLLALLVNSCSTFDKSIWISMKYLTTKSSHHFEFDLSQAVC